MAKQEQITSTGWRIVGSYQPLAAFPELAPGRDEDVLFTAKVAIRTRMGTASPATAVLTALHEAICAQWSDSPQLTTGRAVERPAQRFHGLRWEPKGSEGSWHGSLLWRHPHPESAGAPCTTHVRLADHHGNFTLAIRITADHGWSSVRGVVGAGLARPEYLTTLQQRLRVSFEGRECRPHTLGVTEMPAFVRDVLLADNRQTPVAVLSPFEDGGYAVDPAQLSSELLGLAHLFVLDSQRASYLLSDELGDRRLSCYWGALRVYMPEFSCADRSDQHPLLQRDRVMDPLMRAGLIGNLSRIAQGWVTDFADATAAPVPMQSSAQTTAEPASSQISAGKSQQSSMGAASASAVTQAVTQAGTANAQATHATGSVSAATQAQSDPAIAARLAADAASQPANSAPLHDILSRLDERLGQMATAISALSESNRFMTDEISRLRSTNLARSSGSNLIDRRLQSIEVAVKSISAASLHDEPAENAPRSSADFEQVDEDAISLVDVVRQAASAHQDTLYFLDGAESSAADSPYEDHERLAVVFDIMSDVAERRRSGALGGSLREVFRESGVDYRGGIAASTPERLRRQYVATAPDGMEYECHEHIVLGAGYDPRHCLRIYFTSRAPLDPRFIIGHVGRHLEVKSTT